MNANLFARKIEMTKTEAKERAFNAERNSISLSDDEFETVFERYVC